MQDDIGQRKVTPRPGIESTVLFSKLCFFGWVASLLWASVSLSGNHVEYSPRPFYSSNILWIQCLVYTKMKEGREGKMETGGEGGRDQSNHIEIIIHRDKNGCIFHCSPFSLIRICSELNCWSFNKPWLTLPLKYHFVACVVTEENESIRGP